MIEMGLAYNRTVRFGTYKTSAVYSHTRKEMVLTMKGYERIQEIINQAHKEAPHPIVALVARSSQDMRAGDCQVTIASGESTHDAVIAASTKAGKMKNWVVVVSQLGEDGNHIMPPILCHEPMHSFMKSGMNAVFYIPADADGDWKVYTPS